MQILQTPVHNNLSNNILSISTCHLLCLALIFLMSGCVTTQVPIEPTNARDNTYLNINVLDPAMIMHDGRYYMFHTGRGISNWVSRDKVNWVRLNPVFNSAPEWAESLAPGFDNYISAPSISYHNGTYYLYYSISSNDRSESAIGLVTNRSLIPSDPDFKWEDQGMVIQSVSEKNRWNAIDATLSFDKEGEPWLAFTTHRMGIKLVQIEDDLKTTAVSPEGRELYTIAERHHLPDLNERNTADTSVAEVSYEELHPDSILGQNQRSENCAVEAPFIFRKDDYFYLFATWGRCRLDKEYTYEVVVGRSESITGPYLDNAGQRMDRGGGSVLVNGNEEYSAVAYNSIYTFDGSDYLVAHAYDISDEERTKLVILEMTWDENGWPVVELNRR